MEWLKRYSVKSVSFSVVLLLVFLICSCEKETKILPVVNTSEVGYISQRSARSGGEIIDSGGVQILYCGVCWSESSNPTIIDRHSTDTFINGYFISTLNGLQPATLYYVRAYATNKFGTGYGNEVTFESGPIQTAEISTRLISSIMSTSAISGGIISYNGGAELTSKGICWSTDTGPTLEDPHTSDGPGDDDFVSQLDGLSGNTTYFVRAYAVNSAGTAYGNELSFKTFSDSAAVVLFSPILFSQELTYGTVTDYDWNVYKTIQIGTQTWMAENLKTTSFNNGEQIANVSNIEIWPAYTLDAFCWYNNDVAFKNNYGALYNWYAINTGKLCPTGWHVPSSEELAALIEFLGGESNAGRKLKETGSVHWLTPNTGADNGSGFSALPGGWLHMGEFNSFRSAGYWWSSTGSDAGRASFMIIQTGSDAATLEDDSRTIGISVRCIKD